MFLRDDSAADSDTHPTRRTGFEPFGRDPLELEGGGQCKKSGRDGPNR